MDYSYYINAILNNMGRAPSEIAIKKYGITYEELIHALISTNNTYEASELLSLPKSTVKNALLKGLGKEILPTKSTKDWCIGLLLSVGYIKCPVCSSIETQESHNKYKLSHGDYTCYSCLKGKSVVQRILHKEQKKEYQRKYTIENKGILAEKARLKRISSKDRQPPWANKDKIIEIYRECPEGYQVDHIIPLYGKNVSGLHVENNLQYLTSYENRVKANKFDIDFQA